MAGLSSPPTAPPSGGVTRISDRRGAQELYEEIVREDRAYPIVGLTCRPGKHDPAFDVQEAREIVWPEVPVYVIEPRESRILNDRLPEGLGAYNGAIRVWWPGVDETCPTSRHPLIGAHGGARARLAEQFATPHAALSASLPPEGQEALRARLRIAERSNLLVTVRTPGEVRSLGTALRDKGRDVPAIVLSTAAGEQAPAFPPDSVRSALDPLVPVYVLANESAARRLVRAVGRSRAVHGGDARIYWPALHREDAEHPLVPAEGADPVGRLVAALELSRPQVRGHFAATQERLESAVLRAAGSTREARDARAEGETQRARAEVAQRELARLREQVDALHRVGIDERELSALASFDRESQMQRLIFREWLTTLDSADRRHFLLCGFRFGPQFLDSLEDDHAPRARVAFACAMVACGRAVQLPGFEPRAWREGTPALSDGLMCNVGHGRRGSVVLCYRTSDGVVEFDSVRSRNSTGDRG